MLENNNFHENQLSETEKQAQTIKNSDYLYLEKLDFKPELRKSWLNFFVTRSRVVFLLILLLIMLGVFSFSKLPRESSPEVKIPIGVVITSYPGASPSDVEELVTKKIETKIAGLADIKKISSTSANSLSSITVEYDAKANLEDSFRKLRDKINDVKTDLPSEANEPIFKEISLNDTPIWSASLVGPYDGFTLREYGNKIKEELEKIPGVREVRISGGDEKEFEVAYDPNKLTYYKIAADQANQIIKSNNLAIPSGTFEGEKFSYPVRSDSRFFSAEELGNIPLFHSSEGAIVYLKDVAKVQERVIKKTVYSRFSINGQKPQTNVSIEIIKKTGGSIIEAVNTAEQKIKIMLAAISPDLHYDVNLNMAELIDKDFKQLNHDLLLTFILVFIILFVIIGFKEALVAGLAIPLVFSAAFGVMLQAGISLNFLSIFSLILSLGLLVDDAIVVVSATKQYLKTGKFTPEEAVLLVLNDFKMVLTTTTLTTVWAFLPLLFSTGIMGEYIKSIPVTVSVTLLASLVIAIIINHPLAATLERIRLNRKLFFVSLGALLILALLLFKVSFIVGLISTIIILAIIFVSFRWYRKTGKPLMLKNEFLVLSEKKDDDLIKKKLKEQGNEHDQNFINRLIHGLVNFNLILPVYEKYLRRFVTTRKNRLKVLGFTSLLFIFAILLPITGIVQSEFFPVSDQESVFIDIEAPIGLNLEETDKYVIQVEEKLLPYKEIANFATLVGVPSQFSSSNNGSHLASITIRLKDKKERKLKSYQLEEKIRQDLKTILGVNIKVSTESGGPPAGSAFEARISGDDLQILDRIAKEL
ncbi:MAG: efflux RND transporter permease subunit, partial [Planctomycetes bacterium]|nr:efflux RND transporter permease subunit [Planctomycetota bacterium]